MSKILVTENIVGKQMEILKMSFDVRFEPELWKSPDKLKEIIPEFEALIIRNQTIITSELIAVASKLKVIGRHGVGIDNVDLDAASQAEVLVTYAPEQNAISVAELVIGLALCLARKIPAADRSTREGNWERQRFTGTEIFNKTMGIVGLGRIGFRVGTRAQAFGMDIIAHDPYVNQDSLNVSELRAPLLSLDDLCHQADYVTCHLPLTDETQKIFNYDIFCSMKPTAFFINLSRGGIVNEGGLLHALQSEQIAGAALDVRQDEPPRKDIFSKMENVILTPHVGGITAESRERVVSCVCKDVAAVLQGNMPVHAVNSIKFQGSYL